jgi:peroxiredoxin Q/BCP
MAKIAKKATKKSDSNLLDIVLPSTQGTNVALKSLKGKRVVLYFYPKDMTPGCTIEGHEFTKLKPKFSKLNTVVYGVSRDSLDLHNKFKAKECYTIELLSDVDEKLCKSFDVIKDKNMYGKIVKGIERSTFVLDEDGEVIKEWRKVKAEGHAQEVFDFIQSL